MRMIASTAPPHMIMGYTFAEVASLGAILSIIVAFVVWLISKAIVEPSAAKQTQATSEAMGKMTQSNAELRVAINELNVSTKLLAQQFGTVESRVNDHGHRLRHIENFDARVAERLGIEEEKEDED